MWVKICGNTSLEDAQFAAEAGADALGFVFAASPRQVSADTVRRIVEKLPPEIAKYGVFVDWSLEAIASTVVTCGLTGVQLHRSAEPRMAYRLRQKFLALGILQVLHYANGPAQFEQQLTELKQDDALDAVLVDSSTARAVGGTGTSFDWVGARSSFLRAGSHLRLVAAGGLNPGNVGEAVQTLRPWGVDVVSGVEQSPGKKDLDRVLAFIQAARAAPVVWRRNRQ